MSRSAAGQGSIAVQSAPPLRPWPCRAACTGARARQPSHSGERIQRTLTWIPGSYRHATVTAAFSPSGTSIVGTPPKYVSARTCAPTKSSTFWLKTASAYVKFEAPSTATKISTKLARRSRGPSRKDAHRRSRRSISRLPCAVASSSRSFSQPLSVVLAKRGVTKSSRMLLEVLEKQQFERHARTSKLRMQVYGVGSRPIVARSSTASVKPFFQRYVAQSLSELPTDPRALRSRRCLRHHAHAHPERPRCLTHRQPLLSPQSQNL